jgi:DNA-directed RNA polymerase specialized sigma24 family protein
LRKLPRRPREAIALRYYSDLSEAQTAEVMGVRVGSVKAYTSRGLALLAEALEVTR